MPPRLYTTSFLVMAAANLFMCSSHGSFNLFPLFITDLGGNKVHVGLLMGATSLSAVLSRPLISTMIDRLGRKRSYTVGVGVGTLLPLVYPRLSGSLEEIFWLLAALRLIQGVAIATSFTAIFTYVADITPAARLNEGLGTFGITGLAGMALGPFLGEMILKSFGFGTLFTCAAALAAAAFFCHLPMPESFRRPPALRAASFWEVGRTPRIRMVAAMSFLFGVGLAAYGGFVAPYGRSLGLGFVSYYFLAYSLAAIMTRMLGGRLADRVGEARVLPQALIVGGAGLLVLVWLSGPATLVVAGLLTGVGHGFLFPGLSALALRGQPPEVRGQVNGIFLGSMDAGAFLGSLALGWVGDRWGFRAIFLLAALALFSGLALAPWRRDPGTDPLEPKSTAQ